MALKLSQGSDIRRTISILLASAWLFIAAQSSPAQSVHLAPSVTSMGFGGGNRPGGIPPSVTSLNFGRIPSPGHGGHNGFFPPHHRPPYFSGWGGYYAYPVFIGSDDGYQSVDQPSDDPAEYRGGPTIFDRRGDGQYSERHPDASVSETDPSSAPELVSEVADQPQTVLVFKDGHRADVSNYAIVGNTLYDLSGGIRHKIALKDLDLTATAQQNDDRGVDFELPKDSASN